MKDPTPAEWQTMRARAVTRIAAAETELTAAHDLLERCDTALEGLGFGASTASANVHCAAPTPRERLHPDSILEIARAAGASRPRLDREPEGLRLTIGPVDDPVAIGRAILKHEPVGHPWTFLGSRQVLIYPGVSFRFERWQGVQVPLGLLPPLSTVGSPGNRGAL